MKPPPIKPRLVNRLERWVDTDLSGYPIIRLAVKTSLNILRRAKRVTRRSYLKIRTGGHIRRFGSSLRWLAARRLYGIPEMTSVPAPDDSARFIYLLVDHTVLCVSNTGIQRTVRGIAESLHKHGPNVVFVKWSAALQSCIPISLEERFNLSNWNGPPIDVIERRTYRPAGQAQVQFYPRPGDWLVCPEALSITFQDEQISFALMRWVRERSLRIGCVFYDAIPIMREEYSHSAGVHAAYMSALRYADVVWPISNWSGGQLLEFWESENATLPKPVVSSVPLPGTFPSSRTTTKTPSDHVILSVGTIEPRKNQTGLVRAFQKYLDKNPYSDWRLILVGNLHPLVAQEITDATKNNAHIQYVGHITDAELGNLYNSCAFTVFPSLEEGFGLPILESLWRGKPCLCANFGAMAEVAAGGGCMTVDVRNTALFEDSLKELIETPNLRHRLTEEAFARPFSTWSDYNECLRQSMWPIGQVYFFAEATASWDKNTGIQRVARQTARAMMEMGLDLIAVKRHPTSTKIVPMDGDDLEKLAAFTGPDRSLWRAWRPLEEADKNSWFFMPELPLHWSKEDHKALIEQLRDQGIRSAAVFFDAIPWKMKDVYSDHYGDAHASYMNSLACYDFVASISNYSANDLTAFLCSGERPFNPERLGPIILPGEFPETPRVTFESTEIRNKVSILAIGTVEPRKNHRTLLPAFIRAKKASSRDLHLTIVGTGFSIEPALAEWVRDFIVQNPGISWIESADDAQLASLLGRCDFTIYPSVEEGFGLPILESLWHAKPVICANFGAMAEVATGGGCLQVDVTQVDLLADGMVLLADDDATRMRLTREAVERNFKSWNDYAQEIANRLSA